MQLFGLLLCCLFLMAGLGKLHATPIGDHAEHAGCVRVTIIKQPLTTAAPVTTTPPTTTTVAAG
ncbi:GH12843 [Drosophila grimshawi]|uniref:GH12843 n=2 Tax=Drosophila grimshawi TaxID=7222 RepID=B4JLE1_DROGR|nr:GH12843 [Drosophila grimshawi]